MESSPEREPPATVEGGDAGSDAGSADSQKVDVLISDEVAALQELALRGSWRTIIEKVSQARSFSLLRYPHEHLVYLTFNAIALTKLRRFTEAMEDIESSVENLDSPSYRYEAFPHIYPNRKGSMVPFSLRWIHALLPTFLKSPDSLDRLYLLLNFVRSRIDAENDDASSSRVRGWRRREELVIGTIISIHSSQKEFGVCLNLLRYLLNRDRHNPYLLSKLGYIQLQFGDLDEARISFNLADKLILEKKESSVEDSNLVGRNKALLYMVGKDYVSSIREYDQCIERDSSDAVAINNKALCLMYLRDLTDSIKVLENSLERVPTAALNETLVVNLCSMYELAFVNHFDLKKTLSNWIARIAPDDFDASCTRI